MLKLNGKEVIELQEKINKETCLLFYIPEYDIISETNLAPMIDIVCKPLPGILKEVQELMGKGINADINFIKNPQIKQIDLTLTSDDVRMYLDQILYSMRWYYKIPDTRCHPYP